MNSEIESETAIAEHAMPAESLPPPALPVSEPVAKPSLRHRVAVRIGSAMEWVFGSLTLIVGLAIFSVIPLLNFLSLGYLLEVSGRVARNRRIRDGFIGIRKAAVIGRITLGTWLVFWPVRFVSGMWKDAEQLLAPGTSTANGWAAVLFILTILTVWHVVWACLRGGKLRHFFWPAPIIFVRWLREPEKYESIRNAVINYLRDLNLPYYFWLGARGFVGAVAWLIVPVGLLIIGSFLPQGGAILLGLLGSGLLLIVAAYLPFLQAHFACENRFGAMFELGVVRRLFRNAPIAFWFALLVTLLFAIPLYLLKIEFPPDEIAWLPSLLFVAFIFPARVLTGWAMSRALNREEPRSVLFLWLSRLAALPVAGVYVFFVYVTQYLTWNGALSMLEQHAFLVPAPMMSL